MSILPDQIPDNEMQSVSDQDTAKLERARFRIPAEVGVAARTFDKYAELAHPANVGEESRVKTIETVIAKMKAGGVESPHLLFADVALSVLPDNLITPAIADTKERLKANPTHGFLNTATAIELSANSQPDNVIFQNAIHGVETPREEFLHTETKARAGVFSTILEQEASVYAIAREWNQSKTVEDFGKGIGPAVISAYESASKIVEDNPDPYIIANVIRSMWHESKSNELKQKMEQKYPATKWKYANIPMPSNIISGDLKP